MGRRELFVRQESWRRPYRTDFHATRLCRQLCGKLAPRRATGADMSLKEGRRKAGETAEAGEAGGRAQGQHNDRRILMPIELALVRLQGSARPPQRLYITQAPA